MGLHAMIGASNSLQDMHDILLANEVKFTAAHARAMLLQLRRMEATSIKIGEAPSSSHVGQNSLEVRLRALIRMRQRFGDPQSYKTSTSFRKRTASPIADRRSEALSRITSSSSPMEEGLDQLPSQLRLPRRPPTDIIRIIHGMAKVCS